ncbi:MAG: hypothetical protein WKF89_20140 [Chitinophagaceae bacterium]
MQTNRNIQVFLLLLLLITVSRLHAQKIDEVYNSRIKEFTTATKFLPASVLDHADDAHIPSPLKFFGTIIGTPGLS